MTTTRSVDAVRNKRKSHMQFSLAGKVAVVTGASRGIGRGIALAYAEHGADLVLASRSVGDLEKLRAEIEKLGRSAVVVETDMLDLSQAPKPVEVALAEFGKLDVLVNNAGGAGAYIEGGSEELLDTPVEAVSRLMQLNVIAPAAITKAAAVAMKARGSGSIINITSLVAHVPRGHLHAYSAAKAAMEAFTVAWSESLGPYGIRVNAIAPGGVMSGNLARLVDTDEKKAALTAKIPIGRIGVPEDAAACAVFLASDEASWVSGASLLLSGGRRW